jgi:hypothetical protein
MVRDGAERLLTMRNTPCGAAILARKTTLILRKPRSGCVEG